MWDPFILIVYLPHLSENVQKFKCGEHLILLKCKLFV